MTSNVAGKQLPGSVGFGVGVEVSIRDDGGKEVLQGDTGEVCVRGENVTKGYWNNDKANKEAFWEGRWFRYVRPHLPVPHSVPLVWLSSERATRV
jgi:oxalate---CoA ligase